MIHDDVVVLLLFLFFSSLDVRGALAVFRGEKRKWLNHQILCFSTSRQPLPGRPQSRSGYLDRFQS